MPFGNHVVTAVHRTDTGLPGNLGTYTQVESTVIAPGCHHRPLTFSEKVDIAYDVATEVWKTTIPISEYSPEIRDAILALTAGDAIRVDGKQYEVIGGVQPFSDFTELFKVTIHSKKQTG